MAEIGELLPSVVLVVDPVSTGACFSKVAAARGFLVIALWSNEAAGSTRKISSCADHSKEKVYWATVEEEVSIEETVKVIEQSIETIHPGAQIRGCVPGSEAGVNLAELVSEHLGLQCNGLFPGGDRRNKHVQRNALLMAGCRAVQEVRGCAWEDVKEDLKHLGLPIVVKPVQSSGTDGVQLCRSMGEVEEHFRHLRCTKRRLTSSDTAVLCQEFLLGQEYVVDHVSRNGVHKTVMVWMYEKQPANGCDFVYYAMRPIEVDDCPVGLIEYTRAALDALKFCHGATHAEVIMTKDGPCLVEMNVRMMGANGCYVNLARLLTGTSHPEATLDCLDGERFDALPDVPRAFTASGQVIFLVSYFSGIVTGMPGYARMQKLSCFMELHTSLSIGSKVELTVDTFTFAGILVLAGHKDQIEADVAEVRQIEKEGLFCFEPPSFGGA